MPTGVYLVDDHPDIRLLWRMTIDRAEGLEVVGEAASGSEVLDASWRADVVIVDQMMPGMSGLELTAELRARGLTAPVILCSAYLSAQVEEQATSVGVTRCMAKQDMRRLPDLIREVLVLS